MGVPYPEIVGAVAVGVEVLVPVALILGLWPRISALLLIAFVVVATGLAHRFWEFPEAAQQAQMTSFLKNIAIIGGLMFYYVSGPGVWSLAGRSAPVGAAVPARA
jgi:putative oxidoreductase